MTIIMIIKIILAMIMMITTIRQLYLGATQLGAEANDNHNNHDNHSYDCNHDYHDNQDIILKNDNHHQATLSRGNTTRSRGQKKRESRDTRLTIMVAAMVTNHFFYLQ